MELQSLKERLISSEIKDGNSSVQNRSESADLNSLLLTVANSFLYIGNFYMLGVAAKEYSSALQMPESFSGTLAGVNWTSSVLCAFLYSFWSNYQYKIPTAFCAFICAVGNLMYFLAYDLASPFWLFLGRIMIGVGGSRVINRRYISVYVPVNERTSWNAYYAAGRVLGVAFGTFAAAELYNVNSSFLGLTINGMNSCAFVMGITWLLYFILTVFFFTEPEIIKIEKESAINLQFPTLIESLPLIIVLFGFFFPKSAQEILFISLPIITDDYWGWHIDKAGEFLALISLISSPVHIFVAYTSKHIQDRDFIIISQVMCVLGCLFMVDFGGYSEWQYMIGAFILNLGSNMIDGVSTSLISKVIPKSIAHGIWNAGFLVTIVGQLGRAIGGGFVGVTGLGEDKSNENSMHITLTLLCAMSLASTMVGYKSLHHK
ncbi:unnamed protein product [Blepharisma stoltei]|uniref:Major facilitator superfamily (MFS) profile domain-containing protein n=1 Tax=Blepharisma stoltei TaxID=1481888 RepID=A0AAU9JMU0_9CILI|nr:unnamed protein product [Blepharisma stoltei]